MNSYRYTPFDTLAMFTLELANSFPIPIPFYANIYYDCMNGETQTIKIPAPEHEGQ